MRLTLKLGRLLSSLILILAIAPDVSAQNNPSPAMAKKRPSGHGFSLGRKQPAPTLIQLQKDVAVTSGQATKIMALFPDCKDVGSCTWIPIPWPFTDISLDRDTGQISGTPKAASSVSVHITVTGTDNKHKQQEADVIIQITPASTSAPAILSASLPTEPVGQAVSEHFTVVGGTRPYHWSKNSNDNPPPGLDSDDNGNVTGTPTTPGQYKFQVHVVDSKSQPADASVDMQIDALPDCNNPKYDSNKYFNGWAPLTRERNTNPLGDAHHGSATDDDVQCFYGASNLLAPLTQVQYIYGFGGGANTLSADLLSVQMPAPVATQVSFGTSVTAGGTSTTTIQALQALEAGGNFYIHALYPVAVFKNNRVTGLIVADPKIGFSFNGFAGQATLSQATEQYFSVPLEAYGEYYGLANAGGVYADYRGGFESVPPSFATAAGLSHHNFPLQQVSFGFNFVGLMRIGAQHFFGPSGAFNAPGVNDFNKWHFVIQLAPKSN